MRLSVCLIVRDEAARLPAALASVRGMADEVVVVDTGSTDGTPHLAAELGAKVSSFKWADDFAAARNRSFDLATGDWILWLDADERLASPLPPLEGEAYRVRIVDEGVESWRTRLFRRGPRLIGRIHERFDPPLVARDSDVRLLHEGYVGGPSEAKHRRNLPLLEMELRERPERFDVRVERARTMLAIDDPGAETALDEALAHLDPSSPVADPHTAILIEAMLARPAKQRRDWLRRPAVEGLIMRWFPDSPPLLWALAYEAATADDIEAWHRHLERLVGLVERGEYDRSIGFSPILLGAGPRFQLAGACARLGRLEEAARRFAELTEDPIAGEMARANLQAIREIQATNG